DPDSSITHLHRRVIRRFNWRETVSSIRVLCYALKGRLGTARFSSNWVSKKPGVVQTIPGVRLPGDRFVRAHRYRTTEWIIATNTQGDSTVFSNHC
ncbi:MAG: hypothetical protein ACYCTG_10115, partial [Ferrimicrobium sp.]